MLASVSSASNHPRPAEQYVHPVMTPGLPMGERSGSSQTDGAAADAAGPMPAKAFSDRIQGIRTWIFWALERPVFGHGPHQTAALCVGVGILVMITLSLVCFVLETMPRFQAEEWEHVWRTVEVCTTIVFTIEYLLRLWVADVMGVSAITWVLRSTNMCDLLAVLPLYIELAADSSHGVRNTVKGLRVLRLARFFKLGRYSTGVCVMTTALINSVPALNILVFLFFMGVVFFASAVYVTEKFSCPGFGPGEEYTLEDFWLYNEECNVINSDGLSSYGTCCQYWCGGSVADNATLSLCTYRQNRGGWSTPPQHDGLWDGWEVTAMHEVDFKSIPTAMWWASVTMTTVGYGDLVPKYWLSKVFGSAAMLSGMLIIAMPFAIVGARFGEAVKAYEAHGDESDPKQLLKLSYARTVQRRLSGFSNGLIRAPFLQDGQQSRTLKGEEASLCSQTPSLENGSISSASINPSSKTLDNQVTQEQLHKLQRDIRESVQLKQKILELQLLRSNLWTSAEHAMAGLVYDGIVALDKDAAAKIEGKGHSQFSDRFCEWSCFMFHRDSRLRRTAIWITQDWFWFDQLIILAIVSNSVILALQDYYEDLYDPPRQPWENKLQKQTEAFFIYLFTAEFALKVIAQGFVLDKGSYLQEAWNWLDFIVVVGGIVTLFSVGDSDVSNLRTVRVLRPLRTLSAMPGMRSLVNTVFLSLPRLKDVTLMALFLLMTFGVLGLHFWGGVLHRLCRITPQPLHFTQRALQSSCDGWCFDNMSDVTVTLGSGATATISSSVLFDAFCRTSPQCLSFYESGWDYYLWPVDTSQERFCGNHACSSMPTSSLPSSALSQVLSAMGVMTEAGVQTTCGSPLPDDEKFGPQTVNSELSGVTLNHWDDEVRKEAFNWGITNYDQLGAAFLLIIQCVTLEGWVDIMYMLQDADNTFLSFFYFLGLVMIGAFFLVNVIIAIVMDAFQHVLDIREAEQEAANERLRSPTTKTTSESTEVWEKRDSMNIGFLDMVRRSAMQLVKIGLKTKSGSNRFNQDFMDGTMTCDTMRTETTRTTNTNHLQGDFSSDAVEGGTVSQSVDPDKALLDLARSRPPRSGPAAWMRRTKERLRRFSKDSEQFLVRRAATQISSHWMWNSFIMLVIALNVVMLSLDNYRDPVLGRRVAEYLNAVFNGIFYLEFLVLHVALGPYKYWSDAALRFDGIIVLLSIFDFFDLSSFSSLRAFRLLRIFKLAKRVPSMRVLMKAIVETLLQMRDFVLLLCLVIIVFALVGQSFFGGKFMFDPDTGELVPESQRQEKCAPAPFRPGDLRPDCVPRAHFDSFLWACMTIFQILTGENWNVVMYDGMRAAGWPYLFFFILVIVFGNFVILNLFLAMLMSNFEESRAKLKTQEESRAQEHEERLIKTQEEIIAAMGRAHTITCLEGSKPLRSHVDTSQAMRGALSEGGASVSHGGGAGRHSRLMSMPSLFGDKPLPWEGSECGEEKEAPPSLAWTPDTVRGQPVVDTQRQARGSRALTDMKVESASDSSQDKSSLKDQKDISSNNNSSSKEPQSTLAEKDVGPTNSGERQQQQQQLGSLKSRVGLPPEATESIRAGTVQAPLTPRFSIISGGRDADSVVGASRSLPTERTASSPRPSMKSGGPKLPGCIENSTFSPRSEAHVEGESGLESIPSSPRAYHSTPGFLIHDTRRHSCGALMGVSGRGSFLWSRKDANSTTSLEAPEQPTLENRIRTISTRAITSVTSLVDNYLREDASTRVFPEGMEASSEARQFRSTRTQRLAQEGSKRSMCLFSDGSLLRRLCFKIVTHKLFDRAIMSFIVISSFLMIFQNPLRDPNGWQAQALKWTNVVFTAIFTVEMVMKVIAYGLCCGHGQYPAYLKSSWNILDGAIVSISVIDVCQTLIADGEERSGLFATLQIFRLARVLRPLRLISRNESLKIVVRTIGDSLPELRNLLLFSSSFFLIFGLLGVTAYKGSFYTCLDSSLEDFAVNFDTYPGTALCVPNIPVDPSASQADGLRFVLQRGTEGCGESSDEWMRPTRDTPICEVRCSGGPAPFCQATSPWGYHIMRCSDCQQTFCPNAHDDADMRQTCEDFCSGHELFCEKSKGSAECMAECISECLCGPESGEDFCYGLVRDAAVCVEQGGRWVNKNQHFNHVWIGILSLFEIATTEGWVDVMYSAVDSNGEMMQPVRDRQELVGCTMFVAFMFIGCFFVLNLCVGVIIDNYCKQKAERGHFLMTEGQYNQAIIRWVEWQKVINRRGSGFFIQTNLSALPPTRRHLVSIVSSAMFENAVMACIIINTAVMGMQWHPEPKPPYAPRNYSESLSTLNFALSLVFNLEALMKLGAFHMNYFKDSWNIFDFVCVVSSDAFLVLQAIMEESNSGNENLDMSGLVTAFRIFRIARLFRLLRFLKGLNQLFRAFILSVPKLLNVFFIMCLLIYVYAVLGLNLFAKVHFLGLYNEVANFRTFFGAISLLIRSMTGEAWNEIMHNLAKDRFFFESYVDTHCVDNLSITAKNFASLDLDGNGIVDDDKIIQCGTWTSYIYFVTYTVSVTFVILNLFIAVIFEGFDESQKSEVSDVVAKSVQVWKKYDPEHTMQLPVERVLDFIDEVIEALCKGPDAVAENSAWYHGEPRWEQQYSDPATRSGSPWPYYSLLYIRMMKLELMPDGKVTFTTALRSLVRRIICQGGLSDLHLPPEEARRKRRETVRALEVFDEEMSKRYASKDSRGLAHSPVRIFMQKQGMLMLTAVAGSMESLAMGGADNVDQEDRSLKKLVAATKIQRRYKERMAARRAEEEHAQASSRSPTSHPSVLTMS